jgi:hypothetical protein
MVQPMVPRVSQAHMRVGHGRGGPRPGAAEAKSSVSRPAPMSLGRRSEVAVGYLLRLSNNPFVPASEPTISIYVWRNVVLTLLTGAGYISYS